MKVGLQQKAILGVFAWRLQGSALRGTAALFTRGGVVLRSTGLSCCLCFEHKTEELGWRVVINSTKKPEGAGAEFFWKSSHCPSQVHLKLELS